MKNTGHLRREKLIYKAKGNIENDNFSFQRNERVLK